MSVLPGPLVSAAWLAGQTLKRAGAHSIKIIDASWYMPSAKRDTAKEFEENRMHIAHEGFT
jgi:hypothetical protein